MTLHADRHNVQSMAEAREARLEERKGELEKENSELLEQISTVEGENARLLERPSSSHASGFLAIPREQYEEWIIAKARVEVVQELGWTGFIFEMAMEEARVKAHEARLACGHDPTIPQPNAEDNDDRCIDHLEDTSWCDSAYNQDEDGEEGGDQGGDGH